jgi:hypothetical protein
MQPIARVYDGPLPYSADSIATAQTLAAAGDVTLDGSLCVGGIADLTPNATLEITSTGDDSGITFTVTGKDEYGNAQSEVIQGEANTAYYSAYFYSEVSRIEASGATDGDITIGNLNERITEMIALDPYCDPLTYYQVSVISETFISYSLEGTSDNPNDPVHPCSLQDMFWFSPVATLTGASGTQFAAETFSPLYVRLFITGSGQVRFTILQYGSVSK